MENLALSIDTLWVLICASFVFFMQAGFAMVETGFTRSKNAGNIIMKNLMDFSVGSIMFWVVGFGLMFGTSKIGLIGHIDFFSRGTYDFGIPTFAFLIFQTVFCATAATIVSGAMAERTKFIAYLAYSFFITTFLYPIIGHWTWGGGWLSNLGFHDFAGSTVVHSVGGWCALVGAFILGPRIGKYTNNRSNAIPGHSITLGALGVFILWFGWFGFNPGSTLGASSNSQLTSLIEVFLNTNLAASMGAITAMLVTWYKYKKPDVSMTLNGVLAGLVGITAGCDVVSPVGAICIGFLSGGLVVLAIEFIDQRLKIDDPVGAVGVHGVSGALGTVCVGLFSTSEGLFYTGQFNFLLIQVLGVLIVMIAAITGSYIIFKLVDRIIGLRVSENEEYVGLDLEEHGIESYADFHIKELGHQNFNLLNKKLNLTQD